MKVNGDFLVDFDVKAGMIAQIDGTLRSDMEMSGMMSMKTTSALTMKRLP
jgi:hypothetical protein